MPALSWVRLALMYGGTESCRRMDNRVEHIPHIGIVAGTAEGAALCYRIVCQEAEGVMGRRYAHPEVTLHSFPLHRYVDAIDREDWGGVAALMSQSAAKLVRGGANLIICPNNTLHKAFGLVESAIPWIHIAKPVVREVVARRWRRVGVLGTQTIMDGAIYSDQLRQFDVEVLAPRQKDRVRIQHIIRTELVAGVYGNTSARFVRKMIAELASMGAEAVILGCTELPLLMSNHQTAVPLLDSTRLLARAALRYRVQEARPVEDYHFMDRRVVTRFLGTIPVAEQD